MGIKVRATARGEYRGLREEGDEFEIAKEEDMGSWMVKIDASPMDKPSRATSSSSTPPRTERGRPAHHAGDSDIL